MASVLIISQYRPEYASKGSASRLATMVEHLFDRGMEIDFLHVGRRREPVAALPIARRCLRAVRHISLKHRIFSAAIPKPIRDAARPSRSFVLRHLHSWSQKLQPAAPIESDIAAAIRQSDPEIVWVNHTLLAAVLPNVSADLKRTWIVDTHDVMYQRDESRRQAGLRPDYEVSRAEEIRLLEQFQLVIAIQDAERAVLEQMLPRCRVVTVRHALPVRPMAAQRPTLCFVGSRIDINIQGIRLFIEQAWPAIVSRCPQARLEVVGSVCRAPELEKLAAGIGESIALRGTVPSTDEIYDGPAAVICPLWAGSGLKIKMVEALTYGKATVTTPIGAQGLEAGTDKAFLLAKSPADFIEPVLRLLNDPRERERWEASATIFAREQFSEQRVWGELDAELDRLVRRSTLPMTIFARPQRQAA